MVRLTEGGLMIRESARNGFFMESEAIVQKIEKDGQPSKGIIKRRGELGYRAFSLQPVTKGLQGPWFILERAMDGLSTGPLWRNMG